MIRLARLLHGMIIIGALAAPQLVQAQEWPTKPVTVIVPFVAGGTTDIVGRILAQALTERLGQRMVVENIGGAGGNLGATNASKATPDGYTIFMSTIAHTIAPGIYTNLTYNFEHDFDPVTVVATVPNILVVNPSLPVRNVAELIAYIKSNPGQVNYGSAGIGSTEHMAAALFRSITGADIVHVPYRGGAPMMADLVAGHIQMAIETSGSATPFIKSGHVRALAISPAKHSALFSDLPTLAESGLKDYDFSTWYGFLFPKGVPEPIRQKLYAALTETLKDPKIVQRLHDIGAEPGGMPSDQFKKFIHTETEKWVGLAKQAGIKAE